MSEASSSAALEGGRRNALIPIAQTDWPSCSFGGGEEEEAARRMLLVSPEDYFVRERPTSLGQSSRRKKGAERGGDSQLASSGEGHNAHTQQTPLSSSSSPLCLSGL